MATTTKEKHELRVFSFGGGVQSTAALVLAANGMIDFPVFLFANVGDDSENPDTLAYLREYALPFAQEHEIELSTVSWVRKTGEQQTLYSYLMEMERSVPIPVYLDGKAPGRRGCTWKFKITVIAKELRRRGATPESPATLGVGISLDEFSRMRSSSPFEHYRLDYPLIRLRLTRNDAITIIRDAGLPVPPKSSCWFCPFKRKSEWLELAEKKPELFAKAIELEEVLNARSQSLGRGSVCLSSSGVTLRELRAASAGGDDDERPRQCMLAGFCTV